MSSEQKALASHRLERAKSTLSEAMDELSRNNFRLAVNRAYYSIFYAMRALLATVGKDSSKHSGVVFLFNEHFIRQGLVSRGEFY
ncbi:MAG: HEPN domain-containing protein [Nitrospinae bacterium]|nr:HEPN domain-containing protein [Nitrospinota bacterium]